MAPLDWRFDTGPHGKPALAPGVSPRPLSFNLSHARGLVACAVAEPAGHVDVGLDVELVTRRRLARHRGPLFLRRTIVECGQSEVCRCAHHS